MFIHNLKYAMKTMLRNKTALIWTLIFPIALGSFMYMSFGKIFEMDELLSTISVAVVREGENHAFEMMLEELAGEEEQLLEVTYAAEEEARKLLEDEEITGIIFQSRELRLVVKESSYEVTVLETILNEYKKQEKMLTDIAINYPQALEEAVGQLNSEKSFYVEKTTSDGNQDIYTNYFYAIFAMSSLFASFGAVEKIGRLQANVSPLGMRRSLSPGSKGVSILAEFLSMLFVQLVVEVLALVYFTLIGVDFGSKYPQIIGILCLGSCIGIALGVIVGSVSKLKEGSKSGICVAISMVLSVMADLVASGVKDSIEHTVPILNRINPAALIVDSFYALNIYDTNERYFQNMAILGGMTAVLLAVSYMILRRNKYASV